MGALNEIEAKVGRGSLREKGGGALTRVSAILELYELIQNLTMVSFIYVYACK